MQHALTTCKKTRVALTKAIHKALDDFCWMFSNISNGPTWIAEVVPLLALALGYHNASGAGAGGVWFPHPTLSPPKCMAASVAKRHHEQLDHQKNLNGSISNSDLELAGGLLHLKVIVQHFNVQERTILSKMDNPAVLFWQHKGSAATDEVLANLLQFFGIHQPFHRYVPLHNYISGKSNPLTDDASHLFHLTDSQFLEYFNNTFPQHKSFCHVHLPSQTFSTAISALHKKMCKPESLLVEPQQPAFTGASGPRSQLTLASVPYSKPSRTRYHPYKSLAAESIQDGL